MKKFGTLLLGSVMLISLIGCDSQPKISSKEKDLIINNEMILDSKKSIQTMKEDGYQLNYDDKLDALTLETDEYQFVITPIEGEKWDKLKFVDKNGEFIYCNEIKTDSDPTLISLASVLTKYDTNMANMRYELEKSLLEHRLDLKSVELDKKYPARKKLSSAGYELTGFLADTKGQNTISSTWTRKKQEDGKNVDVSLNIIEKSYSEQYEGSKKIEYSYCWSDNIATINAESTYLKYDFNKNKIVETNLFDGKSETIYMTQVAYIKQEFEKELKRIGINAKDLVMPE